MITVDSPGTFKKTQSFLEGLSRGSIFDGLEAFAQRGVAALAAATPRESGETAQSWGYEIIRKKGYIKIEWYNTHVNQGSNIAILIQYGHGTGTGGYVPGQDYINPAIRPIFDQIIDDVWKKVTNG